MITNHDLKKKKSLTDTYFFNKVVDLKIQVASSFWNIIIKDKKKFNSNFNHQLCRK